MGDVDLMHSIRVLALRPYAGLTALTPAERRWCIPSVVAGAAMLATVRVL